jgi:hypothetical protein
MDIGWLVACLYVFREAEVNDMLHVWDGEGGLRNVGGQDDLPQAGGTLFEDAAVFLPRDGRVDRQNPQGVAGVFLYIHVPIVPTDQ